MKRTGFQKTLGRRDYVVKELRIYKNPQKTEVLTYLDFTSEDRPKPKFKKL